MTGELDEAYLVWLYSLVGNTELRRGPRTHWSLLTQLHNKEFQWFVPNDDNRMADGWDLRAEFLETQRIDNPDPRWMEPGCSMLELFVGLARRLSFEGDGEPFAWFWHLIETLELAQYTDANYNTQAQGAIDHILTRVINRSYLPNGTGGLFPLRNPSHDQRQVDLWYQLNAYLNEL